MPAPGASRALDDEARDWVERTLASLGPRERAGQLVTVWLTGGFASADDDELGRVARLVEEEGIGGLVVSVGLPHEAAAKLNRLQARARVPLLVSADLESGPAYRFGGVYALPHLIDLGGATAFPPAMAVGAIGDPGVAFDVGRVTAREARAIGVHLNFAPVLDVNSNPENPIINTRSFGEDPARVATLGTATLRGLQAGGLLATAKHFPGHGDTRQDSHIEIPVVAADAERLERVELVPFRGAIEAGVDAVMTAHVALPGILGPDPPPATLSPELMTGVLRDQLGFTGLLYTDALDMGAIVRRFEPGEAAVRAVEAGADVVLMPEEPRRAIEALVGAVESGRLEEARLCAAVRRLLEAKARAGLHRGRRVDLTAVAEIVGSAAHRELARRVAARSITVPRDLEGLVPIDSSRAGPIFSLTFGRESNLEAGRTFDARLAEAGLTVETARAEPSTHPATLDSLAARATAADLVILSAYVRPRSGAGSVDLPPALVGFARRVYDAGTPLILLSFGSPYLLSSLPEARSYALAWGGEPVLQRAAAEALLGLHPVSGRLPISLPPHHRLGEGLERPRPLSAPTSIDSERPAVDLGVEAAALGRVDRMLRVAVADSVAPGAALAVGRSGGPVRLRGYGRLDWSPDARAVTGSSIYDLASLTKVVATTTAVLLLVQDGRLALDDRVAAYLPEWERSWKREVTVRQLLLHRSGLPPHRPLWRERRGREAFREAIAAADSIYAPGDSTAYSDLGFIALGFVVEQAAGRPLDRFLRERVIEPLDLSDTSYAPGTSLLPRIAPTELDTVYRMEHVRGVVHDENAHAMGGLAGHAGLFSSARDLAAFARWWLEAARAGTGGESERQPGRAGSGPGLQPSADVGPRQRTAAERPRLDPALVAAFTARYDSTSSRALGWDTPSPGSSAGLYLTPSAFGHTGFTGTSLWIDPELDLFVVLLTNRVNPTRHNRGHRILRSAVHDAVALALTEPPGRRRDSAAAESTPSP